MKIKDLLLILALICLSGRISSQNTLITFRSSTDISIRINKPIDKAFNFYIVSDKLDLKPNISINYGLEVDDFCSLKCEFSNGKSFDILLSEGDSLVIENTNKGIVFKGNNAAGNQYLVDNYCNKGLAFYYQHMESIIKRNISKTIDFKKIDKDYTDSIVLPYSTDIEKMEMEGKISRHYAEIMSQNLQNAYSFVQYFTYRSFLYGQIKGFKPTVSDSIEILKKIDQIYTNCLTIKNPLGYYYFFPNIDYYILKYRSLDQLTKDKLLGNYDKETFNYYVRVLQAPDSLQPILIGQIFISQLQNMDNYFDSDKMFKYLSEKFPNSEYLPFIKELMKKQKDSKQITVENETKKAVFLNSEKINSLIELANTNGLKGKRVYIDLWSVYCMPCKMQFQYNEDLHKLLKSYDNIISVNITIDELSEEANWKNQVEYYHLSGYQLMASKSLYKNIQQVIYKNGAFEVPRYILLDTNGKILDNNLPRPQAIDKLKEIFDKELK